MLWSKFTKGGHKSEYSHQCTDSAHVTNLEDSIVKCPNVWGRMKQSLQLVIEHYHLWPCLVHIYSSSPSLSFAGVLALSLLGVTEGEIESTTKIYIYSHAM